MARDGPLPVYVRWYRAFVWQMTATAKLSRVKPSRERGSMALHDVRYRRGGRPHAAGEGGWSLLEMAIVVAIILIAASVAFMSLQPTMRQDDVTTAYNITMELMRRAHDQAIAQRRVYVVSFNAAAIPNTITVSQNALLPTGT